MNESLLAHAVVVRSVHPSLFTAVGARSIIGISSTIGHDVGVSRDCIISGNCIVARNVVMHEESFLGAATTVRENVQIGRRARVMAGSIVVTSIPDGAEVSGNFAYSHVERLKQFAIQTKGISGS